MQTQYCTTCHDNLPLDDFYQDRRAGRGHQNTCKPCTKMRAAQRQATYAAHWLTHDPYAEHILGVKRCGKCRDIFPVRCFARHRSRPDGLQKCCRACHNMALQHRLSRRAITDNDCCEICDSIERLCIDHCHVTGRNRGILCWRCNVGIGLFADDHVALQRAVAYIKKYGDN